MSRRTASRDAARRAALVPPEATCVWCGGPAATRDEDGDPACVPCAAAGVAGVPGAGAGEPCDAAGRRTGRPGGTGAMVHAAGGVAGVAAQLGLSRQAIYQRVRLGWTLTAALTTPSQRRKAGGT